MECSIGGGGFQVYIKTFCNNAYLMLCGRGQFD